MNPDRQLAAALAQAGIDQWAVIDDPGQLSAAGLDRQLVDGVGDMAWLVAHRELRLQPARLLPGLRRIVVVLWPYQTQQSDQGRIKRARYAAGKDYHQPLRKILARVGRQLRDEQGEPYACRACVDSAPVNERQLAGLAELGWQGRNALLLHPRAGSYHFIGVLLTAAPLSLRSGAAAADRCGRCDRCERACPTQALVDRRCLSERCISYLTIEHQGVIPRELARHFDGWWYGCDICQEVCPWNRFAGGAAIDGRLCGQDDEAELLRVTAADFARHFAGRAIRRIGYARFRRNLLVALWSQQRHQHLALDGELVQAQARELGLV